MATYLVCETFTNDDTISWQGVPYTLGTDAFNDIVNAELVASQDSPDLENEIIVFAGNYTSALNNFQNYEGVTLNVTGVKYHDKDADKATVTLKTFKNNGIATFANAAFNATSVINNAGKTITLNGATFTADTVANAGTFKVTNNSTVNAAFSGTGTVSLSGRILNSSMTGSQAFVTATNTAFYGDTTLGGAGSTLNVKAGTWLMIADTGTLNLDAVTGSGYLLVQKAADDNLATLKNSTVNGTVYFAKDSKLVGANTITAFTTKSNATGVSLEDGASLTAGSVTIQSGSDFTVVASSTLKADAVSGSGTLYLAGALDSTTAESSLVNSGNIVVVDKGNIAGDVTLANGGKVVFGTLDKAADEATLTGSITADAASDIQVLNGTAIFAEGSVVDKVGGTRFVVGSMDQTIDELGTITATAVIEGSVTISHPGGTWVGTKDHAKNGDNGEKEPKYTTSDRFQLVIDGGTFINVNDGFAVRKNGVVKVTNSGTLTVSGGAIRNNVTVDKDSTVNYGWGDVNALSNNYTAVFSVTNSTLNFTTANAVTFGQESEDRKGELVLDNAAVTGKAFNVALSGTVSASKGTTIDVTGTINNAGTISIVADGTTLKADAIANTGSITIDATGYKAGTVVKVIDLNQNKKLDKVTVDVGDTGAKVVYGNDGDVYLHDKDVNKVYVSAAWSDKKIGDEVETSDGTAYFGINAFTSMLDAMDTKAATIQLESNITETLSYDYEYKINKNTTITAASTATAANKYVAKFNPTGKYDIIFDTADGTQKTLTIDSNVEFEIGRYTTPTSSWWNLIWTGYYGSRIVVNVDGTLHSDGHIWNGSTTNVGETGKLSSDTEAFVIRRGKTITINGSAELGDTVADRTAEGKVGAQLYSNYYSLLSGTIDANNTLIQGGYISIANTPYTWIEKYPENKLGYSDEGPVNLLLDNTIWESGVIQISTTKVVQGEPEKHGSVLIELINGSTFSVSTDGSNFDVNTVVNVKSGSLFSLKTVTNSGSVSVDGGTFSATSLTNSGTFTVDGVSTLNIGALTGKITANNGSTIKDSTVKGTLAVGNVTFKGANEVTALSVLKDAEDHVVQDTCTVTVGSDASLKTNRFTLAEGLAINVTGNIEDALTAEKPEVASFEATGGLSLAPEGTGTLNATNAYIKLGGSGTSPKNYTTGTYTLSFKNSIVDIEKLKLNTTDAPATFKVTFDGSVLNNNGALSNANAGATMIFKNGSVATATQSFKNGGDFQVLSGSKFSSPINDGPGYGNTGNSGKITVDGVGSQVTLTSASNFLNKNFEAGTIFVSNSGVFSSDVFENDGAITVTTGGELRSATKLDNVGTITFGEAAAEAEADAEADADADETLTLTGGAVNKLTVGALTNTGKINVYADSEISYTGENTELLNPGTINIDGASFETPGYINNRQTGKISVADGGSVTANGKDGSGRSIINFASTTSKGVITIGSAADGDVKATKGTLIAAAGVANNGGVIETWGGSDIEIGTTLQNYNAGSISMTDSNLHASKVTNAEGCTFTVAGESTLKLGTLEGKITLANGTITSSSITTGGILDIAAETDKVAFSGDNVFVATDITNAGTITIDNLSTLTANSIAGGTIELTDFDKNVGVRTVITVNGADVGADDVQWTYKDSKTGVEKTYHLDDKTTVYTDDSAFMVNKVTADGKTTVSIVKIEAQGTLLVNTDWSNLADGTIVTVDKKQFIIGLNAFGTTKKAFTAAQNNKGGTIDFLKIGASQVSDKITLTTAGDYLIVGGNTTDKFMSRLYMNGLNANVLIGEKATIDEETGKKVYGKGAIVALGKLSADKTDGVYLHNEFTVTNSIVGVTNEGYEGAAGWISFHNTSALIDNSIFGVRLSSVYADVTAPRSASDVKAAFKAGTYAYPAYGATLSGPNVGTVCDLTVTDSTLVTGFFNVRDRGIATVSNSVVYLGGSLAAGCQTGLPGNWSWDTSKTSPSDFNKDGVATITFKGGSIVRNIGYGNGNEGNDNKSTGILIGGDKSAGVIEVIDGSQLLNDASKNKNCEDICVFANGTLNAAGKSEISARNLSNAGTIELDDSTLTVEQIATSVKTYTAGDKTLNVPANVGTITAIGNAAIIASGNVANSEGGLITLGDDASAGNLTAATLTNNGTIDAKNGSTLNVTADIEGALNNKAALTANASTVEVKRSVNTGTMTIENDAKFYASILLENSTKGQITFDGATLAKKADSTDATSFANWAGIAQFNNGSTVNANITVHNGQVVVDASTINGNVNVIAGSFTVGGASTLNVGALSGTINVLDGATLTADITGAAEASSVVFNAAAEGVEAKGITLAADANISAAIVNNGILNATTLTAGAIENNGSFTVTGLTAGAIENNGTITVNGDLTTSLAEGAVIANSKDAVINIDVTDQITAYQITGGKIVLDTTKLAASATASIVLIASTKKTSAAIYDAAGKKYVNGDTVTLKKGEDEQQFRLSIATTNVTLYSLDGQDQTTLYVNKNYKEGDAGDHVFGFNAFSTLTEALKNIDATTTTITVETPITQSSIATITSALSENDITLGGEAASIKFTKGTDLLLTVADGKTFTINSGITTTNADGYIVLNSGLTSGTFEVNSTLSSETEVAFWGKATVSKTGKIVAGKAGTDQGIVLFRAGKAGAENAVSITGDEATEQVSTTWVIFASGDLNTTDTVIKTTGFQFSQDLGGGFTAAATEFKTVDEKPTATLTSKDTTWNVGFVEAAGDGITAYGAFNFDGGAFNVTSATGRAGAVAADFGDKIAISLTNGAALTVENGTLSNAGSITGDADSTISAKTIVNTGSFDASNVTAETFQSNKAGAEATITGNATIGSIVASIGKITLDGGTVVTNGIGASSTGIIDINGAVINAADADTVLTFNPYGKINIIDSTIAKAKFNGSGTLLVKNSTLGDFTLTSNTTMQLDDMVLADINQTAGSFVIVAGTKTVDVTPEGAEEAVFKDVATETTFTGVNSMVNLTVNAGANLTISAAATIAAKDTQSLTVTGDIVNNGTITINATGLKWGSSWNSLKVVAGAVTNSGTIKVEGAENTMAIIKEDGIYLYKVEGEFTTDTLCVNAEWSTGKNVGDKVTYGGKDYVFGMNAFATVGSIVFYADTTNLVFAAGTYTDSLVWVKDGVTLTLADEVELADVDLGAATITGDISADDLTFTGDTTVSGKIFADELNVDKKLAMDWTKPVDVTTLNAGANSITIGLDNLQKVLSNTAVITAANGADFASIVANYNANEDIFAINEAGTTLSLNAAAIGKVSKTLEGDGVYATITGAVANDATKRILIVDGDYSSENVYLNGKQTQVLANDEETVLKVAKNTFAGGIDVSVPEYTVNDFIDNFKNVGSKSKPAAATNVTIDGGTFSGYVLGADMVKINKAKEEPEKDVTFYRYSDVNLTINGGTFETASAGGVRAIAGGLMYAISKADGNGYNSSAKIFGDIDLTISGGTFKGYNVYGGNYANNDKFYGAYTSITGDITITLDATENDIVFQKNNAATGIIQAGSFGPSFVYGDTEVILTGSNKIEFQQLIGGSTADEHIESNGKYTCNSYVTGNRTLTFSGFNGDLDFSSVQDFNIVSFEGANEVNFEGEFHRYFNYDVTTWVFADDGDIAASFSGDFLFDFAGDTVDLTKATSGFSLLADNVSGIDTAKVLCGNERTFELDVDKNAYILA